MKVFANTVGSLIAAVVVVFMAAYAIIGVYSWLT